MPIVLRNPLKTERSVVEAYRGLGVATVHEAQARTGLLAPHIRPIYPGAHIAGTAVTVSLPPGDNWMIHVAIEQCGDGDVLVVAPTSRSEAGYIGDLIATALSARGVRGVVIDAGCRDVAELRRMGFPVWSACVCAYGTVKETLGDVNVPIVCAGRAIQPGDVVVADDDGVVTVARADAERVLAAALDRERREAINRQRYASGELSLDVSNMRDALAAKGLTYAEWSDR
jgi:4-hydroxy-4-methyl-2-oxoglutarate aldolase